MNSRNTLARPRVDLYSSRVAMKVGHIVPPTISLLRQSPDPLHFSMLRMYPLYLEKSNSVLNSGVGSPGTTLRLSVIEGVSVILPGLNMLSGSHVFFRFFNRL